MSTGSDTRASSAEELSALVDGELHEGAVAGACGLWRTDAGSRATWHAYQLIGDVLRSEDLASDASRDAAFLQALRGRLATEPVVLAPQPVAAPQPVTAPARRWGRRGRWTWAAPSAVAAGFVAVAGVLVVTRGPGPAPSGSPEVRMAEAAARTASAARVSVPAGVAENRPVEPQPLVVNGQLIRDAGLDRYLAAHKHFAGSAALGVPSTFLRSATVEAPGR